MNEIDPAVIELQSLMWANKLRVGDMLRKAGVAHSTWTRWTNGARPLIATVRAIRAVIDAKIAEAAEPAKDDMNGQT